ncbi:hypothetical protein F5X98DRAFT_376301 [Xylaria grammica]|nr:hypothetical protein F5X98DRAFT_376301 [Xylaria grammica]
MMTPEPQDESLDAEFVGVPPPNGAHFPKAHELIDLCGNEKHRGSFALPSEPPVFWVKYGLGVYWNEVVAQDMAYHELRRLGSPVRAPAVFYAVKKRNRVFIVMEYIPGVTVGKCLEQATSQSQKEHIIDQVALSLSELHRITIAPGSRPAAVNGGYIRHTCFDEERAPRHYEDVDQLETHLNGFLKGTKQKSRIKNLSLEPLVFCQSDVYPDNFMINDAGDITVIDFADVSILPSSFATFQLYNNRLGFNIRGKVWVPTTEGVDNTQALLAVCGRMPICRGLLENIAAKLPGGDEETQNRIENSLATSDRLFYP